MTSSTRMNIHNMLNEGYIWTYGNFVKCHLVLWWKRTILSKSWYFRLRSTLKNKSKEDKNQYSKQRNYCVSLLRKSKSDYFEILNGENINYNKTFWKATKPFLLDEVASANKMPSIGKEIFLWVTIILQSFEHFLF